MKGKLIILSGPSGAGKGTVIKRLLELMPEVRLSISCTTREARAGETEGVTYFYISDEEFERRKANGEFFEYATVFGKCSYGTLNSQIEQEGIDVILEIDVQGALKAKAKRPDATMVFLAPPSMEELRRRITDRGRESGEEVERRLKTAEAEMAQKDKYDYVVINDEVERAAKEIAQIIKNA